MNVYDETNLISSDEYTDEEDDFMNEVIVSQSISKPESIASSLPRKIVNSIHEHKTNSSRLARRSLIKGTNYERIYKKKYISWLNNKVKREKYKQILLLKQCKPQDDKVHNNENVLTENNQRENINSVKTDGSIISSNTNVHASNNIISEMNDEVVSKISTNENTQLSVDVIQPFNKHPSKPAVIDIADEDEVKDSKPEIVTAINQITDDKLKTKADKLESNTSLYKEINEMFLKYDDIIGKHVTSKNSIPAIDEFVSRTLLDIHTLSNMLHAKELEWNRLLHLKKVKEEMLARFLRKKHIIEIKDKSFGEDCYTLSDLNDLISNLSKTDSIKTKHPVPLTTQQLVENRANMKSDDLEKEQLNTTRLHSILVSNNILPNTDGMQKYIPRNHEVGSSKYTSHVSLDKGISSKDAILSIEKIQNLKRYSPDNEKTFSPTLERLLSAAVSNNHSSESNIIPTLAQDFKQKTSVLSDGRNSNCYRLQAVDNEFCNEVSIIPVTNDKVAVEKQHRYKMNFTRPSPNATKIQNLNMDTRTLFEHRDIRDNAVNIRRTVPMCQECRAHESRFVCGGCGNQWYCSRSCQVSAWDKHSEICSG